MTTITASEYVLSAEVARCIRKIDDLVQSVADLPLITGDHLFTYERLRDIRAALNHALTQCHAATSHP